MHRVVLFTRPGCHLCQIARDAVLRVRSAASFTFDEVDIETDDDLVRDLGLRIPVIAVDGVEVFDIEVDERALLGLVRGPLPPDGPR
jgi:glutaredoxin